jgi:hypothetical protein
MVFSYDWLWESTLLSLGRQKTYYSGSLWGSDFKKRLKGSHFAVKLIEVNIIKFN